MLSFSDPGYLKSYHYSDSCLQKHTNALIAGGDSLINDWNEVILQLAELNCCPDRLLNEHYTKLNSNDKFIYAKIQVVTFGWWNCAIKYLEYSTEFKIADKEFRKLFLSTKEVDCEEL